MATITATRQIGLTFFCLIFFWGVDNVAGCPCALGGCVRCRRHWMWWTREHGVVARPRDTAILARLQRVVRCGHSARFLTRFLHCYPGLDPSIALHLYQHTGGSIPYLSGVHLPGLTKYIYIYIYIYLQHSRQQHCRLLPHHCWRGHKHRQGVSRGYGMDGRDVARTGVRQGPNRVLVEV
jgi:hypothetical protein